MDFLKTIKNSIYSPGFYQSIPRKSFASALKYFLLLGVIIVTLQVIYWFKPLSEIGSYLGETLIQKGIINCFPEDLEISVRNGIVSTNVQEPYFIKDCRPGSDPTKNIWVIDTKTPFSLAQFELYQTAVWITNNGAVVYSDDINDINRLQLYQFKDTIFLRNTLINKDSLNQLFNRFSYFLNQPLLSILSFFVLFLGYIGRLVYLLPLAIIIWLIAKIFKRGFSYTTSYKAGMYAMTLGFLVELILIFTSKWTHFTGFPFIFSMITLAVITVNLGMIKSVPNSDFQGSSNPSLQ